MEKSFLYFDDDGNVENLIIIGNDAGLVQLKESIDKALSGKTGSIKTEVEQGFDISIECRDKYYIENDKPRSMFQKISSTIIGVFLIIWFILLPFVAIGYLLNDSFFGQSNAYKYTETCKFPECITPIKPLEFDQNPNK